MGEVSRARDTKLNRDVALKVLPTQFALDADQLARFTREAQVLASLNHPNIAAIHGFEDSAGVQALVPARSGHVRSKTVGSKVAGWEASQPSSAENATPWRFYRP